MEDAGIIRRAHDHSGHGRVLLSEQRGRERRRPAGAWDHSPGTRY